jgi:hypothetical protein
MKADVPRCVVCNRRLIDGVNHKCPKSVLALYDEAERLADLADDPEEPGLPPIDPAKLRRFRKHGLILEFA